MTYVTRGLHVVNAHDGQVVGVVGHDASGRDLAAEAHEAGAVVAAAPVPVRDVSIRFTVHGSHDLAHALVDHVRIQLEADPAVRNIYHEIVELMTT